MRLNIPDLNTIVGLLRNYDTNHKLKKRFENKLKRKLKRKIIVSFIKFKIANYRLRLYIFNRELKIKIQNLFRWYYDQII